VIAKEIEAYVLLSCLQRTLLVVEVVYRVATIKLETVERSRSTMIKKMYLKSILTCKQRQLTAQSRLKTICLVDLDETLL
jgi:hypothetical protein